MEDDFYNDASPHSQASGSPSAPVAEGSFNSAADGSLSGGAIAPPPANAAPQQSAPWDQEGWGTSPKTLASPPLQQQVPAAPAAAPLMSPQEQPPARPVAAAPTVPAPASPPAPSPHSPLSEQQHSPTAPSASSDGPTPAGPAAPAAKPVNASAFDALQKQIAGRTAAVDAATKKKEAEVTAAAAAFIKQQQTKREREVSDARAKHKQEQQAGAQKIDAYRKSGAVWSAVGMLVDLQRPNPYCKGTERMRGVLGQLNAAEQQPGSQVKAA